jgi:hypothetical protein
MPQNQPPRSLASILIFLASAIVSVGIVVAAILYITNSSAQQKQEKNQQEILNDAVRQKANRNYNKCIVSARQALLMPLDQNQAAETLLEECQIAQENLMKNQLDQATQLVENGRLKDAIALANEIPADSPTFSDAQQLIEQWSERMLQMAQQCYKRGQVSDAFAISSAIPQTSSAFQAAQQDIQTWQIEQDDNEQHWQLGLQALERGDWAIAIREAEQISNHAAWRQRKAQLFWEAGRATREQEYRDRWQKAQQLIEQGEPNNAIVEISELPDAPPWQERKESTIVTAKSDIRRREFCQRVSFGLFSECP